MLFKIKFRMFEVVILFLCLSKRTIELSLTVSERRTCSTDMNNPV